MRPMPSRSAARAAAGELFGWTSAARTHVGLVRRRNEDACLARPERGLWAVADGMGGHALGALASRLVIGALDDLPMRSTLAERAIEARDRLVRVNRSLRVEAERRGVPVIGSTVAVLVAGDRHCACLWAGDSRIYRQRRGRIVRLTADHRRIDAPRANPVADTQPRPPAHRIARAVGAGDTLRLDAGTTDVEAGDVFLLCSDGLTNEVRDLEIERALAGGDCRRGVAALLDLALRRGGHDNISIVLARADLHRGPDQTAPNARL